MDYSKHKKTKKEPTQPNFILCEMGTPYEFRKMCQNFPPQQTPPKDWLIIDNETGEIIKG